VIPITYAVPDAKTSPIFAKAFARGCGGRVEFGTDLSPGPVAMFGSPLRWDLLQQAFREGRTVYYADHGYFGRHRYFRITRNGYQHDGTGDAEPSRFAKFNRPIQKWRTDGRHVLICPNSETYFRLFGLDVHAWVRQATQLIAGHSDRPVKVRWKGQAQPIQADLEHCWAVVTYSSAAALDALIAGVPVFVLASFAAAFRMGTPDLTRIESPVYPDGREPFLWNLAQNQWTLDEIRAGDAWRALSRQAVAA